jgi:hypothetical protein
MGVALAIALLAFLGSHLAIVATLLRRRAWWRALCALTVPPLAPWWAWDRKARSRPLAVAWLGALGAYAALVLVALTES